MGVTVGVTVGVSVGVSVGVGVAVDVAVSVGVLVAVGVGVATCAYASSDGSAARGALPARNKPINRIEIDLRIFGFWIMTILPVACWHLSPEMTNARGVLYY